MEVYNRLKQKFAAREKIVCTTISFFDEPMMLSRMKRADLDFIIFDMEHGRFDSTGLVPQLHMCRVCRIPSVVRVPEACYHLIAKTIDMGADGIMLPRTETLAQVKLAIDSILFHPVGRKGFGGSEQWRHRSGETLEQFQATRYLIPQIESPEGIKNLPAMLENYGDVISAVLVGPYDMSFMLDVPMKIYSETVKQATAEVFDICRRYGKSAGVYCENRDDAAACREMGGNVLWSGVDGGVFFGAFNNLMNSLSDV